MKKKKVAWFSAGVSSFIACYLTPDINEIIYIDIDDQHSDSIRFVKDCEKVLDNKIKILKSPYKNVENAVLAFGGFRNISTGFYPCTGWLKKRIRKEWEDENKNYDLTYVWGMDLDEQDRADNLIINNPNVEHKFPLIEKGLKKEDCHAMCLRLGIKRPIMYDLGYNNNNCIGCVKGGMGYWNKIRKDFPDVFKSRAELERKLNNSILNGIYLDELEPKRGRMSDEVMQECSVFCEMALKEQP